MSTKEWIPGTLSPLFSSVFIFERVSVDDLCALTIKVDDFCTLPTVEGRRSGGRSGNGHVKGRRHCTRQALRVRPDRQEGALCCIVPGEDVWVGIVIDEGLGNVH